MSTLFLREIFCDVHRLIVHLDGGDAFGGTEVSITREGDEAILNEVVGPCLIAADTCVDMMCVESKENQRACSILRRKLSGG